MRIIQKAPGSKTMHWCCLFV